MAGDVDEAAVLEAVLARPAIGAGRIVGIDGPAGAGKSTLARRLGAAWGVPVFEADDFFTWTSLESWWGRFSASVLDALRDGRAVSYLPRDWIGDRDGASLLSVPKVLPWAPLAIVEGVSVTRAVAADRYAFRIWVDAPAPLRLARGVERDGSDQTAQWAAWQEMERAFFAADGTAARADLRVDTA